MDRMKIFLSHAPADAATASTIYDRLRANGFLPWLRDKDLIPGTIWRSEVKKAVENSDVVIVCVSAALISGVGFMHKETLYALDVADEQPEGAIFVIPLKLENCKVPERLSQLTPVNYFEEDGYIRLLQSLNARREQLSETVPTVAHPEPGKLGVSDPLRAKETGNSIANSPLAPEVRPQPAPFPNRRRKFSTVLLGLGFLVVVGLGAGLLIRKEACPSVRVPRSHFVKSKGNRKVIIFVHGVLGDVDNTWVDAATHTSWPDLISADPAMKDYDIYVYGYKSSCGGDASDITEIANRMGQQLQDDHFFSNFQEIDFITHSMGGLVTKRMLSSLNTPSDSNKLQLVHTVLFIAVPAAGAPVASLAVWLSNNPQFKNMSPVDSHAYLQSIDQDWANMSRARTSDRPFPHYYVAYETADVASLKIVPALYSSTNSDLSPIAFDYNHITIVKPTSIDDDVYKWARARILGLSK
jgi:pimeloyl-ACP methyl ester carboxylesterase